MAIGLVTNIPDNLVVGGIENMVKGHSEFNHSQAGSKMSGIG